MTLDRTLAPEPAPLSAPPQPLVETAQLANGAPVYLVRFGDMPVVDCSVVSWAGTVYEAKPNATGYVAKMLLEGAGTRDAAAYAETLDELGASVSFRNGFETFSANLSCLTERFDEAVELLADAIYRPHFPAEKFELQRSRERQALSVQAQRTEFHARRLFRAKLWGESHPYGRSTSLETVDALELADVVQHHQNWVKPSNAYYVVAGQFEPEAVLAQLNRVFGADVIVDPPVPNLPAPPVADGGFMAYDMPNKQQATLRLGLRTAGRDHPDYHALQLLTTVLGGYFGSRLMSNLREEKGFTYGIGAQWSAMRHGGLFVIGTDVGAAYTQPALAEIRHELVRLRKEPLPERELAVARNYRIGRLLMSQETPFQVGERVKSWVANGVAFDDVQVAYDTLQRTTPSDLHRLAQVYLDPDAMTTVVAGPPTA